MADFKDFFSNSKKGREKIKRFSVVLDKEYQKKLIDVKEALNVRLDAQFLRGAIDYIYEITIKEKSPKPS